MTVDLRQASFDAICDFVCDRPTPPDDRPAAFWWWDESLDSEPLVDPAHQIAFMTWLFKEPGILVGRYSPAQIDQAFWFMFGAGGEEFFARHLWEPKVPWAARRACLASIANLYPALFSQVELGDAPFMLWDFIAFGYDSGTRKPLEREEDRRVQDAIFEELNALLATDEPATQRAALHGLGHLSHRDGRAIIEAFLSSGRWVEPEIRQYAEGIAAGNVL